LVLRNGAPLYERTVGWSDKEAQRRMTTHDDAYGTFYRVDPARLVLVLMIQLMPNSTDICEKFPTMVYPALIDAPK
jgi:hypothetical protein